MTEKKYICPECKRHTEELFWKREFWKQDILQTEYGKYLCGFCAF